MPDFTAFFAADLPSKELPFTVAGQECSVTVRPMDHAAYLAFQAAGMRLTAADSPDPDELRKWQEQLVRNCVVDWTIRRQKAARYSVEGPATEMVTEETRPSTKLAERGAEFLRLRFTPEVWNWIVEECLGVCGLREPDAGNSAA
ncbi:MAG: hypothetical protein Q7R40_00330 [Phaeospirillum sp.]|nr:hypothetical protein [Phaeospirillum sp.]